MFALVDSGAPVSLMSKEGYDAIDPNQKSPLSMPTAKLSSVTGQSIEVIGTATVTFFVSEDTQVAHLFHIASELQPYDVILGLDFLAKPEHSIRHEPSNFILCFQQTPIRLFNSSRQVPCATVLPVQAKGRHQYVGPRAVTFVKVNIPAGSKMPSNEQSQQFEFHPHPVAEGSPQPMPSLFDASDIKAGNMLVGLINVTSQGMSIKNDEPIGYLTPVNTQKFQSMVAAVVLDRRESTEGNGRQEVGGQKHSRPGQQRDEERDKAFLETFQYGELTGEQLKSVQGLLLEYRDCFVMDGDDLGLCNKVIHRVETTTDEPIVTQPYRVPQALEAEVKVLIQKMLDQNLIRKSNSEYSSPVVLVEKPDKSLRLCVNYQKLNAVCKKRMFPLPNPDELLAKIGENQPQWFSSTDLAAAFHQVPIHEEDKHKTAFSLPWATYEWNILPTGLSTSPICFARLGQDIFGDLLSDQGLVLFIDDLCMYGPTFENHLQTWKKVLTILRESNLKLKPSKTHLFTQEGLKFLGHHIGPGGISPNPQKIEAIQNYPTPKNIKQVRSFVALCSYFRKHVKSFATMAAPLNKLTRKGHKFDWTEDCDKAFTGLKEALLNANLLAFPQFGQEAPSFILATDASDSGLGGWLSQEIDGERRPISFFSRTLTTAEANYSTIEKEALAIVACIRAFHYYLHGRSFILESDHAPLKYVLSASQRGRVQNTRLERWKLALQALDMQIRYIAGPKNIVADSLSRGPIDIKWNEFQKLPALDDPDIGISIASLFAENLSDTRQAPQPTVVAATNCAPAERPATSPPRQTNQTTTAHSSHSAGPGEGDQRQRGTDIRTLQREDEMWQPLIEVLEGKTRKGTPKLWKQVHEYTLTDSGVLAYHPEGAAARIVVPGALVPQLIAESHSHALAGHYHPKAVFEKLRKDYFWPSMWNDIKSYCDSCVQCHSHKKNHRDKPAPLGQAPVPYGPWETVHTDILGPLPESPEGFRWVLLVVCAFTKFVELVPLKDTTAETVAEALVGTFYRYGLPNVLVSDNGPQYRAKLLAEVNRLLDIKHVFISAYHAQANAKVERMCGIVKNMIATSLNRSQREWNRFLGATQHAINAAYQSSNKWSPAFLMFGRHFRLPIEKALSEQLSPYSGELDDMVTLLRERQVDAIKEVIENQQQARERQRTQYNKRAKEKAFEVGDLVYVYKPVVKQGNVKKLTAKWDSGYVVEQKLSNGLTYECRKPGSRKPAEKVHVNRLKACPQSHVYRDALRHTHVLGTGQPHHHRAPHMPNDHTHERANDGDTDGETSEWETRFPVLRVARGELPPEVASDRAGADSSGVTAVLDAAETEVTLDTGSSDNLEFTEQQQQQQVSAESSGDSEGPSEQPEDEPSDAVRPPRPMTRAAVLQRRPPPMLARPSRPQRNRRPPDRYSQR